MAITYNAGTNTITVTGYTEATPCNFTDIYNADVAGGWGKVTRQCTNQFCFAAGLKIGDGSTTTWFADGSKYIIFTVAPITNAVYNPCSLYVVGNANFRLGTLTDASKKTTKNGCVISFESGTSGRLSIAGTANAKVELYSSYLSSPLICYLWCRHGTSGHLFNMYNSSISGMDTLSIDSFTVDHFNNLHICNGVAGTIGLRTLGTLDRITIYDTVLGTLGSDSTWGVTAKNIYARKNTYIFRAYNITVDCTLINVDSDQWNLKWDGTSSAKVYRKYEFDLKVTDKNNTPIQTATVKIWDKDSNLVVDTTTDANGVIATQTITRGYYNQANGNTLQEASPHLIKIEKAGYPTYEADFTLEEKTDWLIALQTSILRNPSMGGGMV